MEPSKPEESYNYLKRFPPDFSEFLISNNVPLFFFSDFIFDPPIPRRYIRFKPLYNGEEYLQKNLSLKPFEGNTTPKNFYEKFDTIPNFFSIPESVKICNLAPYIEGNVYGIDFSSAAVVMALNPKSNEHILDLCCCPGAKLMFIGDLMKIESDKIEGSLTGVDINSKRLGICSSLLKKYGLDFIELKECDGTKFESGKLYDKILVDAECTHDGSLKHLKKYLPEYNLIKKKEKKEEAKNETEEKIISNKEKKRRKKQEELNKNTNTYITQKTKKNEWTMEDFKERVLDPKKLKEIENLQLNLLKNAIKLVKPGGIIIYSTCSFIKSQNEDIVLKVCEENKSLELTEVFPSSLKKSLRFSEGFLPKTVRFDPITSYCGGMFIAAIRKNL